ncbi:MAG: hypothetical protein HYV62_02455, partial [Candidatus Rokubacteria bacterium]|nr:hypothetical protein [Candidatus Rokubacteria bacterium]
MCARRWRSAIAVAGLAILCVVPADVRAQSLEELKQRIEELERSTREQIQQLKRLLEQREAERAQERRVEEERQRALEALKQQLEQQQVTLRKQEDRVGRFLDGWENFFDLQAGQKQGAEAESRPLGKDIRGNVYTGDNFKLRLGGSLRLPRGTPPWAAQAGRAAGPPHTPDGPVGSPCLLSCWVTGLMRHRPPV